MKTNLKDMDGNNIYTTIIYKDVESNVSHVRIYEEEGEFYAHPDGLSREFLESVNECLVPEFYMPEHKFETLKSY